MTPQSRSVRPSMKLGVFVTTTIALGLLLAEGALQLASRVVPSVEILLTGRSPVPVGFVDERIAVRPNRSHPEHDANGFRNESVPERVDVVTLGDSMSYGSGVRPDESWPRRLAARSGPSVYNMAFPGWGPGQGLLMLDDTLAFTPQWIIQAFFSGNDLFDCVHLVYALDQLPELRDPDRRVGDAVTDLEATDPIMERALQIFDPRTRWARLRDELKLYTLLRASSRIGMERLGIGPTGWQRERASCLERPDYCEIFEARSARTLFTPSYRLMALDFDDPRIREGERLCDEAIYRMKRRVEAAGIGLLVLLIPTKELVFAGLPPPARSPAYREAVKREEELWKRTRAYLSSRSIPFVDGLPALRRSLHADRSPFPESTDGHPNPVGHEVIAELVAEEIRRLTRLRDQARSRL